MIHVVGHTAIDYICRVPRIPGKNESTLVTDRRVFFGGGAANIAAGIARLGEPCTLVSAVGGDFDGSPYDLWMRKLGIEQQFYRVKESNTATAFIFTDDHHDQCTFFEWGASEVFSKKEAQGFSFVHMATADPDYNVQVAENSEFSSFDPGQDLHRYSKAQLTAILDKVSILFANQYELAGMCRILGVGEEDLVAWVPTAVFTMGKHGSMLYQCRESEEIPAIAVDAVDPTGAGDAYRAGFLAGYAKGYEASVCCRIGTVTASFVVEREGSQTNLPDWPRMEERYRAAFGDIPRPDGGEVR